MPNGFESFALGSVDSQYDAVINEWMAGAFTDFPTRPEGPTPDYSQSFASFSDVLRDVQATGESPALLPGETTVDWSQLITRTGETVAGIARTVGDFTDQILGRSTAVARTTTQQRQQRQMGMLPVLAIAGVLAFAFLGGGRR